MVSYTGNQKLFYKLINIQRNGHVKKLSKLVVDDIHMGTTGSIREGLATYFAKLSTASTSNSFLEDNLNLVNMNIRNVIELHSTSTGTENIEEITNAIESLKTGKAPDELKI